MRCCLFRQTVFFCCSCARIQYWSKSCCEAGAISANSSVIFVYPPFHHKNPLDNSLVISAVFSLPGRENATYSFSPGSAEICSGITTAIPPALILEETVWKAVFRFHFDGYIQYCVCTDVSASLNPLHFLLRGCPIRSSGWGLFLSFDYAFKLIRHFTIPHKFRCYFQSFMQKTVRPESRSTGYEMCSSPFSTLTALLLAFGLIVLYVFNPNVISDSYHVLHSFIIYAFIKACNEKGKDF